MIDPLKIPKEDFPLIVFSDKTYGIVEFLIKLRTRGRYNHVMWAIAPNTFATQSGSFKLLPFKSYMQRGNRLKFVKVKCLDDGDKELIVSSTKVKSEKKWWKRSYDYLGIIGQALGIKKVNVNGLHYCSEDVVYHLARFSCFYDDNAQEVINSMPKHESPEGLNEYMKKHQDVFEVYGRWADD